MSSPNIKSGFEARAYQEVNGLIDEGEGLLEACSLENFAENGGAEARQKALEQWLGKAERQIRVLSINPDDAMQFSVDRLTQELESLDPQPPSVAQLRRAFVEIVNERLRLLNTMIGR